MTEKEKHLIVGRLVEDYVQSKVTLVLLLCEMDRIKYAFRGISDKLKIGTLAAITTARGDREIPTVEQFDKLVSDIKAEAENKSRLAKALEDIGIPLSKDEMVDEVRSGAVV